MTTPYLGTIAFYHWMIIAYYNAFMEA